MDRGGSDTERRLRAMEAAFSRERQQRTCWRRSMHVEAALRAAGALT
ncbi:hypothetical protein GQ600_6484 [Phytophthora cactorum]|nr:hypothetical protein GQ600_6484 [Phytophthora cactorum]